MSFAPSQLVNVFTMTRQNLHNQQELLKDNTTNRAKQAIKRRHQKAKRNLEKMQKKKGKQNTQETNTKSLLKQILQHKMQKEELAQKFNVDFEEGLSSEEAAKRLQQYGENKFEGKQKQNDILLFMSQMADPFSLFMWLMIFLSLVAFGLSNPRDTNPLFLSIIIFITIITGAIISFKFMKDSEQMIQAFRDILPTFANVRRNGVVQTIKSEEVVPGDIITVSAGQKVSADLRLIETHHLAITKSIFSGENDQVLATVQCTNKNNPLQSKNILFSGYFISRGSGVGVAIATGEDTFISHLSNIIDSVEVKVTNVETQIGRYVKIMTIFAVTVGVVVLIVGGLIGYDWIIAAMIAIGVTLASAPTVLNLVIIIMLSITVKKLSKQNIICKSLSVIQSLGSTSCLVVDKTGTITKSEMTVQQFSYDGHIQSAKCLRQSRPQQQYDETFRDIHKCAILASGAIFNAAPPPSQISKINSRTDIQSAQKIQLQKQFVYQWKRKCSKISIDELPTIGDSTESALIKYFQKIEDIKQTRMRYPIQQFGNQDCFFSFDVLKKYSYCIVNENDNNVLYIKGYPQVIWGLCSNIKIGNATHKITQFYEQKFEEDLSIFGQKGLRNISFAKKILDKKSGASSKNIKFMQQIEQSYLSDLTFLGIVSLNDPIKQGIEDTILRVKAAGIKIVMVTGDHQTTAVCVARKTGIIQEHQTVNQIMKQRHMSFDEALLYSQALVVLGDDLYKLQRQDQYLIHSQRGRNLQKLLRKNEVIFCKTNPSQKLQILESLRQMGHVLCVIGDGVNDSPVVKYADAGISMGTGANATKQAADIIFADSDINHIIFGIEQGRKIFDNLKKSICYVMTSQMSQWLPFVVLLVFRIPIPVFTLLIDGTADFVPAISFAFEDGELGLMTRKPRNLSEHLVSYKLLAQCSGWMGFSSFLCSLTCYYICMNDFGFQPNALWGKNNIQILLPNPQDNFNPTSPYFGNSRLSQFKTCQQFSSQTTGIDWINSLHPKTDLRMAALNCFSVNQVPTYTQNLVFKQCAIQQISIITKKPVCYTTQAAKYGQTAYMYANVLNQIFNLFICKTRRESLFTQKMNNYVIYMGFTFQLMLALALNETVFMVQLIGTRDTIYMHYGLGAIPFGIIQLILDQFRKYLIRNLPPSSPGDPETGEGSVPNWFERYVLW